MPARIGIAGFRGYSGAELLRLLDRHPQVEPVLLEHRQDSDDAPQPLSAKQYARIPSTPEAVQAGGLALVFLATPADVSMELAPRMLDAGAKVIDLSGAFRFADSATYSRWYKEKHTGGSGLWPSGILQAAYRGRPIYLESGMLSHGGEPGHPAIDCGGCCRPRLRHRMRREIRSEWRGPKAESQNQLF